MSFGRTGYPKNVSAALRTCQLKIYLIFSVYLTQFIAAPNFEHGYDADGGRVREGEQDHEEGDAGSDLNAVEALDDDVVAVVANHDNHPQTSAAWTGRMNQKQHYTQ